MAKLPLDLSKFKKVSSDKNHSVLKHPDGHEIKIFHGKLSPHLKGQIEKLPVAKAPQKMAGGGEVLSDDQASSQMPDDLSQIEAAMSQLPKTGNPRELTGAEQAGQFVGQNVVGPAVQGVKDVAGGVGYLMSGVSNFGSGLVSGATGQDAAASEPSAPTPVDNSNYNIPPPQQDNQNPMGQANPVASMQSGIGQNILGLGAEAEAQGNLGHQEEQILGSGIKDIQSSLADYQKARSTLDGEIQSLVKDVNDQHINPNHYMESMDAGQKIKTAIGLILGGIGGGLTHQENPALKFLNAQIERDVEAQKQELGKKNTLLSAFYHQYGNVNDAMNMARASRSAIMQDQLQKAAAQAKDPMAKARLLQSAGQLQMQYGPLIAKTAITQSLINGNGTHPELIGYLPPDMQERAVANTPFGLKLAASKQDAEEAKKTFSGLQELNAKLEKAKMFSRKGVLLPGSADAAYADSLSKDIAQSIGNLHGLSRMSDVDLGLWAKQAPSLVGGSMMPGGQSRQMAKIKEIQDTIRTKMNEEGRARIMGWPNSGAVATSGSVAVPKNFPGGAAAQPGAYASTR